MSPRLKRKVTKYVVIAVILPIALTLFNSGVTVTVDEVREILGLKERPRPVVIVKPPPTPESPLMEVEVVAPRIRQGGFAGSWIGNSGLEYQYEQNGPNIKLHLIQPDGYRRDAGVAIDEGSTIKFESFLSPTHNAWGNLPPLTLRGEELIGPGPNGTETVYFRRMRG